MKIRKTLYVTRREEWRAWLTKHHQSETEVWLIYFKKHTGQPRIPYDHAVEEALCFGWIDSIVKRIDDEKFAQKFTPRRDSTRWSALNKRRLHKLIREGRMTKVGLAKIDLAMLGKEPQTKQSKVDLDIPRFVKQALIANTKAWEKFRSLSPSHRKAYIRWIMDAKKEETRKRRLQETIMRLEQTKGEPDDIPPFIKQALMANAKAWENFRNLAPSYRRHYLGWIMHATKEETRERRLREAVSLLGQKKKLGLK
ncbi:MAG TPA: YdeI/OmpD-associated family protein [Pyrinomonadaceae bacterium]|nr:YdeI/OmpD-associated family protein [Pyrinomonadaceae bacterium]